jgi:DNA-binding protein HU-beta
MNKSELVAAIAQDSGLTKTDSEKALNSFIAVTTKALKKGDKITIPGFMTASKTKRPARTGRNPQTGKEIKIAAKNVIKFKAGKTLDEAVNK